MSATAVILPDVGEGGYVLYMGTPQLARGGYRKLEFPDTELEFAESPEFSLEFPEFLLRSQNHQNFF